MRHLRETGKGADEMTVEDVDFLIKKFRAYFNHEDKACISKEGNHYWIDLKKIHESASLLDDSGILELLRLASMVKESMSDTYMSVGKLLTNPKKLEFYRRYHEYLNSEIVVGSRSSIVNGMTKAVTMASKGGILGDNKKIDESFDGALEGVISGFKDLKFEIYLNSGKPVNNPNWFSPTVRVCGSLAECLAGLEQSRDGIYICFIMVPGTLDGWFGYFFKSNGNLFSFNDRIDEEYVGQHAHLRNGRYAERKGFTVFPYSLCEFSDETDYKGYATSLSFGENKEVVLAGGDFTEFIGTMLVLVLLMSKYNGTVLKGETVFLDSLLPANMARLEGKKSESTALVKIGESDVALNHTQFKVMDFDVKKVLSGAYDKRFDYSDEGHGGHFQGVNQDMVDAYGDGFVINTSELFKSDSSLRLIGDGECHQEFIGDRKRYELRAYYEIRRQLGEYIGKRMDDEFKEFGGLDGLKDWYRQKLMPMRDNTILNICADAFAATNGDGRYEIGKQEKIQEGTFGLVDFPITVAVGMSSWWTDITLNDEDPQTRDYTCPITGKKANAFFKFDFDNVKQVERIIGCQLPKFCTGWHRQEQYNGNPLLDVVDPVGNLTVPFHKEFSFRFRVGFSKLAISRILKEKERAKNGTQNH